MDRNYDDPIYKKARVETLKRDKFSCQWPNCGCSKRLRVHHIRTWAEHPSLRFELNNLITLCKEHHDFIWSREDDFAPMFFQIIRSQANDKRSKQRGKPRKNKKPKAAKRQTGPKTYAQRYAEAKRKARYKKGR